MCKSLMNPSLLRLARLVLLASMSAAPLWAQGVQTGTLRGIIMDGQNQVLPGATVTVSSPALLQSRTQVTDTTGLYVFRALPPGDYTVTVSMPSFKDFTKTVTVPLGGTVEQGAILALANVSETVQVVGTVPPPLATPTVGLNIKHEEVNALATSRTLYGISTLSPGLNTNTPNAGQVAIHGAFAFDNIFMINGVDVNDNLFGSPQNLFIEDAIEETQVLTSGISAEYGRFSGGVINAITRSGGNTFSGSYRLNLSNPSWISETPFEKSSGVTHADDLSAAHEATFGGPIVKDRLWFFSAGRLSNLATAETLAESGIGVTQKDDNKRGELKFTGAINASHQLQGGYVNNPTTVSNDSGLFDLVIDPQLAGHALRSRIRTTSPTIAASCRTICCSRRSTHSASSRSRATAAPAPTSSTRRFPRCRWWRSTTRRTSTPPIRSRATTASSPATRPTTCRRPGGTR